MQYQDYLQDLFINFFLYCKLFSIEHQLIISLINFFALKMNNKVSFLFLASSLFLLISSSYLFYLDSKESVCRRTKSIQSPSVSTTLKRTTSRPIQRQFTTSWRLNSSRIDPRAEKVKEMMKHAWKNYVKYAWGFDTLVSDGSSINSVNTISKSKFAFSIIESMDTLLIMGFDEEFNKCKKWIKDNLNFQSVSDFVSTFHFNSRIIGSLLSTYALTGDNFFLRKARMMVQVITPAFYNKNGIPYSLVNEKSNVSNYEWTDYSFILAEVGSFHLEFKYLSALTGDYSYSQLVEKTRKFIESKTRFNDLYMNFFNAQNGIVNKCKLSQKLFTAYLHFFNFFN